MLELLFILFVAVLTIIPEKKVKLSEQDIMIIKDKSDGYCGICGGIGCQYHHVVPRSQGGSNHRENLLLVCSVCHGEIHGGLNSLEYKEKTYKYLPDNLGNCWKGKFKPKIVCRLESENMFE